MILISEKHNCCGCSACVQTCPKHCISFEEDDEGFRYPLVDKDNCIDCGLCEKVCPVINQYKERKPLHVYAARNLNETTRLKSSSGGIFTLLAEKFIHEGGVVFGARFNDKWEVIHDYTETIEGLEPLRGSKYLQSIIGDTYKQTQLFLQKNRKVLYTGTPCQIAGLKHFLGKEYDNLLLVDVVCHGVPSPFAWREYLSETMHKVHSEYISRKNTGSSSPNEMPVITGISFRDKSTGWKKFSFVIRGKFSFNTEKNSIMSSVKNKEEILFQETLKENLYMQVFLKNLSLRPSCSKCPAKGGKSYSDISIADYWGIEAYHPEMDDDKGTSLVLIESQKGNKWFNLITKDYIKTKYEDAIRCNPVIESSIITNRYVTLFWCVLKDKGFFETRRILKKCKPTFFNKIKTFLYIFFSVCINKLKFF